jgi:hypothetical protein
MRNRSTLDSVAIDELAKELYRQGEGRFTDFVRRARKILFASAPEHDERDDDDSLGAVSERYVGRQRIAR